ncbi:uncharacterized protein LOC118443644 isoform X7 [Vespa mandarinia]|uniref:uncharacterized protein LOC118443644 isoform X7 n=1 Tax=Vespa mandarinia TaxID=7446 RepID=UPI00161F20B5|nr:uncharacterized protein LOC118443644 isoform X7 [Vespa mandarinia]
MRKFIVIRTYNDEDESVCIELLKASVMFSLNHTFIGILFGINIMRVVNIATIVLMLILMHKGLPLFYSIMVIFIPGIILYISLYLKFLYEARLVGFEVFEIPRIFTDDDSSRFWVAEAYEHHSLMDQEQDQQYTFMTEENLNKCTFDVSQHNKKIVGIMSVCKCSCEPRGALIKRLYVQTKFRRKGIGSQFINTAMYFADEHGFGCVKAIINEFQKALIDFYDAKGFELKLLCHQSVLLSIMTYEYVYKTRHFISNN